MDGKTNAGVFNPHNLKLYSYTRNNPVNLVDPDGNAFFIPIVIFLLKEAGSEVVEQTTGIPMPTAKNAVKFSLKQAAKQAKKTTVKSALKKKGRTGKQAKLRELANDPKLGKADRGWLKQEINSVKRKSKRKGRDGKLRAQTNLRNPPGKDLAHPYKQRAKDGFSYKDAKLKNKADHKLEHKIHGYK